MNASMELQRRNVDMDGTLPPSEWRYNFPPMAGYEKFDLLEQMGKVRSEIAEVEDLFTDYDGMPYGIEVELMDVIHAAETALRAVRSQSDDLIPLCESKLRVVEKNLERGYYGEMPVDKRFIVKVFDVGKDFSADDLLRVLRNEVTLVNDLNIRPL